MLQVCNPGARSSDRMLARARNSKTYTSLARAKKISLERISTALRSIPDAVARSSEEKLDRARRHKIQPSLERLIPGSSEHPKTGQQHLDQKCGDWWMQYENDNLVGYWPVTLFSHLSDSASTIECGRQAMNSTSEGKHTTTQMAISLKNYFNNIQIKDGSNNLTAPKDVSTLVEESNCYDIENGKDDNWGNYFYYGGPGGNRNCL
ncbi:hypothetical protein HYC85_010629 [Camellia sinensis]|uniref:Neprosin PEP catalytic domain-containing protein n=1 Tax=Camellia sinensis TaxID=4442 RepID=A0A7J7HJD7_CAMSI|nr:hypothetical protein HYC85_010629 [Camellia sinensis]